jgi:DNA integrity scanning protein DisA with diadenylate cyclase activity
MKQWEPKGSFAFLCYVKVGTCRSIPPDTLRASSRLIDNTKMRIKIDISKHLCKNIFKKKLQINLEI